MHLITTSDELASVVSDLSKSDFVTVDTEFIRETTFWPELCLIQMAAPGVTALVDPLAPGMDLGPFFELMADETVTKVFHAARQDIEIIFNRGQLIPHPVFDTQVAAMVCGFGDSVSYEQLVQKLSGGQIDKSSRFTDWRQRPLTDKQLTYALADVTHLIDVYRLLRAEIDKEGRAEWLTEEMEILTARRTYDPHPEDAWKRLKMRMRKPQELAVLQAVATWREFEARERNVPRGRVIKDDAIYEVAQQQPRDAAALARLRTIPKGWERSGQATGLIAAVNAVDPEGPDASPPPAIAFARRIGGCRRTSQGSAQARVGRRERGGQDAGVQRRHRAHRRRRREGERARPARLAARGLRREGADARPGPARPQVRRAQGLGLRDLSARRLSFPASPLPRATRALPYCSARMSSSFPVMRASCCRRPSGRSPSSAACDRGITSVRPPRSFSSQRSCGMTPGIEAENR
jgi:ribonuclease D